MIKIFIQVFENRKIECSDEILKIIHNFLKRREGVEKK
jgi:hypothetical protein